jgi:ethylbenzene dioxygenase beta subunit
MAGKNSTATDREPSVSPDLCAELSAFVVRESRLLDDGEYDEWASLFAEDGCYWVPAARGQRSPSDHVSLFYDDKPTLLARVARLRHPQIHVQTPPSRTCHVLSAIAVANADPASDLYETDASFVVLEFRPGSDQRVYGGRLRHVLRRKSGCIEIVMKRVDLVNCDAAFPALAVPF